MCATGSEQGMKVIIFAFQDLGIFMGHYCRRGCLMLFAESTHCFHQAHEKLSAKLRGKRERDVTSEL